MKDELPDLTPYLSKKGGNSQGKGADNTAGKTDISSKLSALVKKTGTFSAANIDALPDGTDATEAAAAQPVSSNQSAWANIGAEPAPANGFSAQTASSNSSSNANSSATSSSSWEQVDSFSTTARREAEAEALAQERMFAQAAAGEIEEPDFPELTSASAVVASVSDAPSAVNNFESPASAGSGADNISTSGNFSTSSSGSGSSSGSSSSSASGTFSTRPLGNRPGGGPVAPSIDRFKAPQARPMNTLSSGSSPVLKGPAKDARPAAPYSFHPSDAPREAVVPKSMQLPTANASTSSSGLAPTEKRSDPPPSWPAQPTSPARIVEKQEKPVERSQTSAPVSKSFTPPASVPAPAPISSFSPATSPVPSPAAPESPKYESPAEMLARAFKEEAKALESGHSDDLLEPTSLYDDLDSVVESTAPADLGALFEQEAALAQQSQEPSSSDALAHYDAPTSSPYVGADDAPSRSLGFGSLLTSSGPVPAAPEPEEHSTLADLMIPTGEHQALFAPERRGEDSPFDEISANQSVAYTEETPVRVDSQAPSFSSLFSTEIVTSGTDYGHNETEATISAEPSALEDNLASSFADSNFTESFANSDFSKPDSFKADLGATDYSNSDFANSSFSNSDFNERFGQDNFAQELANADSSTLSSMPPSSFESEEDMRTADTMFGSGGSNKGSQEELAAADAVFGAVADLTGPSIGDSQDEISASANSSTASIPENISAVDPPSVESILSAINSTTSATAAPSSIQAAPALGKDSLPMAFADAANFEQESLESIKQGIKRAKAEEKARLKAEAEEKARVEAEAVQALVEPVDQAEPVTQNAGELESQSRSNSESTSIVAKETYARPQEQSPKSTAKLSLTEMIELANAAKLEQVEEGKTDSEKARSPKANLSSLLSGDDDEPVASSAPAQVQDDDEDDDGESLGGAIGNALDKLLSAGQQDEDAAFFGVGKDLSKTSRPEEAPEDNSTSVMSGGLAKLLSEKPAAEVNLQPAASMEKIPGPDESLTQTQANKVDALSRLLEVASKAPTKPEDKRNPSDSASKIAAEVNKPPGKVSRQVDTMPAPDYLNQPGQGAAMSSPFGGSSPFSSPFGTPSASQTRQPGMDAAQALSSGSGMANPYGDTSGMPQATVSNDAVSARMAALSRKLEEQSRPPTASAINLEAMAQIQQQVQSQSQSQSTTGTGTGSSPSVNSLSQLPPQVDDSPSTRAELVNRILGSAKISQHGTKLPELPTRNAQEAAPEQISNMRGGKKQSPANRTRTRVAKMPGFDLRPIIAIVIILVVVGGGGFYAYQSGIIKLNLPAMKPGSEAKMTIDQMVKNGELERAREILEGKSKTGKITASEAEKLYSVYYSLADKIDSDDPSEAMKLLEKIPSKSKKSKDAQKLLRKLKKKVKKN